MPPLEEPLVLSRSTPTYKILLYLLTGAWTLSEDSSCPLFLSEIQSDTTVKPVANCFLPSLYLFWRLSWKNNFEEEDVFETYKLVICIPLFFVHFFSVCPNGFRFYQELFEL